MMEIQLKYEETRRKIDNLGRLVIPKSLRDRLRINTEDELDFWTFIDSDGKEYIVLSTGKAVNPRYVEAARVLEELGEPIPKVLADKL